MALDWQQLCWPRLVQKKKISIRRKTLCSAALSVHVPQTLHSREMTKLVFPWLLGILQTSFIIQKGGFLLVYNPNETRAEIFAPIEIEHGITSYDFIIDEGIFNDLQDNIINKNRLLNYDKNQTGRLVITSVEYTPAQ